MPLFEYRCSACGHEFEELVAGAKKNQKVACPECKSRNTVKQLSTFAMGKSIGGASSAAASCPTGTCAFG